ncbi:hypothetical protein Syun_006164 [Stephania yunnanensis]|uniref:Uncharacterized protein n=1 Tax=Stephania yunnanensis TaxID=152371 RepID=A0AAP0KW35_9MAGN
MMNRKHGIVVDPEMYKPIAGIFPLPLCSVSTSFSFFLSFFLFFFKSAVLSKGPNPHFRIFLLLETSTKRML